MFLSHSEEHMSDSKWLCELGKQSKTDKAEFKKTVSIPLYQVDWNEGVVHLLFQ